MHRFSPTFWIALALSVISILVKSLVWVEYVGTGVLAALCGVWYLAYLKLYRRMAQGEEARFASHEAESELPVELANALSNLNTHFQQKIVQNTNGLSQLKNVLQDAANNLNDSFATLNELGQQQKDIVLSVIDSGDEQQDDNELKGFNIREFCSTIPETLEFFIGTVIDVSKADFFHALNSRTEKNDVLATQTGVARCNA